MSFPPVPDEFFGVVPRPQLDFDDLQQAVEGRACKVTVEKRPWVYTTFRQRLWNAIRIFAIGEGIERSSSTGTAIEVAFYCYHDGDPDEEREQRVSQTETLSEDCIYTRTEVHQRQAQVERQWVRWTLTLYFEDDDTSANVENAVSSILDVVGLVLAGPEQLVYGVIAAGISLTGWDVTADYRYVSRDIARPETIWVDTGPPSSHLVDGPRQLSPDECEERADLQEAGKQGGTTPLE